MKETDPDCSILADIDLTVLEEYQGKYENLLERIKALTSDSDGEDILDIDIEYEWKHLQLMKLITSIF